MHSPPTVAAFTTQRGSETYPLAAKVQTSIHGFTLLEVILAMSLTSILMLLVWSLFSTYTKLEERSSRAAVELQLVRSLSQQLRSDLEHFAVLPTPSAIPQSVTNQQTSNGQVVDDQKNDEEEADGSDSGSDSQSTNADNTSNSSSDLDSGSTDSGSNRDSPQGTTPRSPISTGDDSPSPSRFSTSRSSSVGSGGGGTAGSPAASNTIVGDGIQIDSELQKEDIYRNSFDASLPNVTYLRGSKSRLEFATRLPYTVDVPAANQRLGSETRYGTQHLVVYEFRDARKLETMLQQDPILNPQLWNPPTQTNPNAPKPVARSLNPNDNVGLIREMKSWLHATRDRRRDALKKMAEAEGLLVNGELPSADPRFAARAQRSDSRRASLQERVMGSESSTGFGSGSITRSGGGIGSGSGLSSGSNGDSLSQWMPPPEFRHKRDHIPEVTKLQFRYLHDGTWSLDWNRKNQLPKAVEVAFDLDPEEPARRAKEFEAAHAAMLGGQSLQQVVPTEELLAKDDELLDGLDALNKLDLADPTAIVTEYRFVILLPVSPETEQNQQTSDRQAFERSTANSFPPMREAAVEESR